MEKSFLHTLPEVIMLFQKGQIKKLPEGECVSYFFQGERGRGFQVFSQRGDGKNFSEDPDIAENRKTMRKLALSCLEDIKKETGTKPAKVKELFSRPFSIPALAGKVVKGRWLQYEMGKILVNIFVVFYRGNAVRISHFLAASALPQHLTTSLFQKAVTALCSTFYAGEKTQIPAHFKKLLLQSFDKLLSTPLEAMEEAYALLSFVNESPWVFVKVSDQDLVWHKSLAKGSLKEQKYAFLLFSAFLAGNAVAQVKEGICAARHSSGVAAMKKVYLSIKKKDPSFSIPELEK